MMPTGNLLGLHVGFAPRVVPALGIQVLDFAYGLEDVCDFATLERSHGKESQELELEER